MGEVMAERCSAHNDPGLSSLSEWMDWADEKKKTHRQVRCPDCGLFKVWLPLEQAGIEVDLRKEGG